MKTLSLLLLCSLSFAQTPMPSAMAYSSPTAIAPGSVPQSGRWTIANSGANFLITAPDNTTTTVAKAAAVTQSVVVFALPANSVVQSCTIKSGTAFTGTTTLTASLGITGTLAGCVAGPYDLKAAVSATNVTIAATPGIVSIAGTNFILALTSTIDNLSSISAGSVTVWMTWYVLP